MKSEGYTLDLYCDNKKSAAHSWNEFPHQFFNELGSVCRSQARERGWLISGARDLCPKCNPKSPRYVEPVLTPPVAQEKASTPSFDILAGRTTEQFMAHFKGVPAHKVAYALTALTPGINWGGCSKGHMANAWASMFSDYRTNATFNPCLDDIANKIEQIYGSF